MRAGQTNLIISVNVSVDLGAERGSVWHYADVHPLAVTELLSRHCELLNFPVFSPPFNSCSVCASCYTSVPKMCLSDCSQSLGMCSAGAGLPKGSTNVWDFCIKLSDSLGVHSVTWLKSEAWSSEFRAKRSVFYPSLLYWFPAALHISFLLYESLMTLFLNRRKVWRGIALMALIIFERFYVFKFIDTGNPCLWKWYMIKIFLL